MYKFNFTVFQNMRDIKDSMQLDSGTEICKLETAQGCVVIVVRGYVTVVFKDSVYTQPSDFPQELKDLISNCPDGDWWDCDERVTVNENNWFEIFYNGDEAFDTIDIEGNTEKELFDVCIEFLDTCQA